MTLFRDREVVKAEHVKGGEGYMMRDMLLPDNLMHGELTYISNIVLDPGCSLGVHTHKGDSEMYYVVQGSGLYTDGDEEYQISEGDVTFCADGEAHGIINNTDAPLRMVALMQA